MHPANDASATPPEVGEGADLFIRRLARTAWLSVLLGIVLEVLALAVVALAAKLPARFQVLAELTGKVSWSLIVCAGITCGLALHKSRPALMGALGALAGPIAFRTAFALQKGVIRSFGETPVGPSPSMVLALAVLRGVEYGCFGLLLGWISQRPASTMRTYLACGFAIGIVFESVFLVVAKMMDTFPASTGALIGVLLNGVLFPVGCAFVLFTTQALTRRSN